MLPILLLLAVSAAGIQERFVAPCCWNDSLADHRSPKALEMKKEIDAHVAQGKTEQQIVDHYVAQYGERILRVPRGARRTWLFVTPVLFLAAGGLSLSWFLRRQRRAGTTPVLPKRTVPDSDWDW
jgi:cytochrome c-type biogenesis protein CcmH